MYGYDYLRRTPHTPARYAINQREAAIVQYVFSEYAKGQVRGCMEFFTEGTQAGGRLGRQLKEIEGKLRMLDAEKRRVLDIYASGDLSRDAYAQKSRQCDAEIRELVAKRNDLAGRMPLLQTKDAVEIAVTRHCEAVKARLETCVDFDSKRQFLLDFVEKVTFWNDRITVHGSVPVREKISREAASADGVCNLAFCIQGRITGADKMARRRNGGIHHGTIVPVPRSLVAAE